MSALLFSLLTPFFVPTSSVALSYFILAVQIRECLGKHMGMSSSFPIAILNGTCFFPTVQLQVYNVCSIRREKVEMLVHLYTYTSKLNSFNVYFLFLVDVFICVFRTAAGIFCIIYTVESINSVNVYFVFLVDVCMCLSQTAVCV